MKRIVYFLVHVPRCAGTTVERHFERHLGPAFMIAPRWQSPLRNFIGNRYPGLVPDRLTDIRVVSGHSLSAGMRRCFPDAEVRETVLLRDPAGHLVSLYNLHRARFRDGIGPEPPAFAAWYRGQRRNPVSRFLLNRYFEQAVPALYRLSSVARLDFLETRLARFRFVAGHHRTDEMIAHVSGELGVPRDAEWQNVTEARRLETVDLPADLARRIANENRLDQALYDRWQGRGSVRGWDPGTRPSLPHRDQLAYALSDTVSGIVKKLIR